MVIESIILEVFEFSPKFKIKRSEFNQIIIKWYVDNYRVRIKLKNIKTLYPYFINLGMSNIIYKYGGDLCLYGVRKR